MEDLSSKLKKLFKPKPKGFKGKANVLGRADQVTFHAGHPEV
jgi:hypothetical protein